MNKQSAKKKKGQKERKKKEKANVRRWLAGTLRIPEHTATAVSESPPLNTQLALSSQFLYPPHGRSSEEGLLLCCSEMFYSPLRPPWTVYTGELNNKNNNIKTKIYSGCDSTRTPFQRICCELSRSPKTSSNIESAQRAKAWKRGFSAYTHVSQWR